MKNGKTNGRPAEKHWGELPSVGIVVIGLNSAKYLHGCLDAVCALNYPKEKLDIVYVDSGSSDDSMRIANSYKGVRVIPLTVARPSAGWGRNIGFASVRGDFIQFIDSDSFIDPNWLRNALKSMTYGTAAVWGRISERYPARNSYHFITDLEMNIVSGKSGFTTGEGETRIFGGNVLIKRTVLEQTGLFDVALKAGEEPDLSYRVRKNGYKIYRRSEAMVSHDIDMDTFRQYWKRAARSGYAYAQLAMRFADNPERMYLREFLRITGTASLVTLLLSAGILVKQWLLIAFAIVVLFRPMWRSGHFMKNYQLTFGKAILFAGHLSLVIIPQATGSFTYLSDVLRGKQRGGVLNRFIKKCIPVFS